MEPEKTRNKKAPRSAAAKPKATAPVAASPPAKKKVAELHHAPRIVGSIMEKGFSPSGEPLRGLSHASFPQPTVLPFPVARHRSHGPHWAPVGSVPSAVEEEDDMEEDRDDMDYDPIASFANPVERKEKKGLDFSRWREFSAEDDSCMPRLTKKEARPVMGKGEADTTRKEGNKGALNTADSFGIDLVGNEGTSRELVPKNPQTEVSTRVEERQIVENVESRQSVTENLGAPSLLNASARRDQQKPVISDVERRISGPPHGQGSVPLVDDIDAENVARLRQMSSDEIAEAQAEIIEKMNPAVLEMLKKRGRDKLANKKTTNSDQDKGRQDSGSSMPIRGETNSTRAVPPSDWLASSEHHTRSWKIWSERVEKVRGLRFALDGDVLEIDPNLKQPDGNRPSYGRYSVENVAERDFLRTAGDPAALGYTINEAVELIRSMVPGQRTLALQLLASVFSKALHNLQQDDVRQNSRKVNTNAKSVDWQAVWAFALGPEPQVALSLRIALDDNHDSVVLACAKVIQSILSCDINENFFGTREKLATCEKNICVAPVFRSKPEVDGGFLHGGYWKYNTKPSSIIPYKDDIEDHENEGENTIQDDIVVAGQDVAAGLVRMGILPRICFLLEMDPLPALEDCLVSTLIALARHSPTCADAIMRCPRLVQTVVEMFIKQSMVEIHPSQIKAIILLKVLSQSKKQLCLDFVKHGVFQQAMWHWYKKPSNLEHWIKSGKEHCKLSSALMVEQLRLWKVCIHYGFCITHFADFFPALCLWLSIPTFDKLIENSILGEFTSVARETYLVLEALAQKLPNLHSREQLNKKAMDISDDNSEAWSWSHVVPMVDFALHWLSLKNIPYVSSLTGCEGILTYVQDSSVNCVIWVISAILHMLSSVFDRIAPDDDDMNTRLPWLPEFVPKIGLEIIKNGFLNFYSSDNKIGMFPTEGGSLAEGLCHLRCQNNIDASFSSVSCLRGLVRLAFSIDRSVQRAKPTTCARPLEESMSEIADKILEEGIIKWAQNDLIRILTLLMNIISSEWPVVQSVEVFGRGGPAPGIGFGWGSPGGGFWSLNVLLAQADAELILELLKVIPTVLEKDLFLTNDMKTVVDKPADSMTLRAINSILGVLLVAGPGDRTALQEALDLLLQPPILQHLGICMHYFLHHHKGLKSFSWQYNEEDYVLFSKVLNSHFRNRWLSIKKKSSGKGDRNNRNFDMPRKTDALETIHEETGPSDCDSLLVEWAHQRLPLPLHWFLSAICSIGDLKSTSSCSSSDVLDVAKSGLFLLLGLEAVSSFLCSDSESSPISIVHLVWKIHALSMALHVNMDVLEQEKTRDVFGTLQDLYGDYLDQLRCGYTNLLDKNEKFQVSLTISLEPEKFGSLEYLNFQTKIHETYNIFVESLIEQFGAISYGDVIYGRQVALYLHRAVEASVRLAAWNALSNARVLDLLPPIEKCIAEAQGYLEPIEDNEEILEVYAKSWTSGALDRAAARGSISFTLALHHLSCFIFEASVSAKLRNKLAKSLLRGYSQKQHQEGMLRSFIKYRQTFSQEQPHATEIARRFELLKGACEGIPSLLAVVEKLKSSV